MRYIKLTKREEASQKKKNKIVEESIKLFMRCGYNRTTIADISEATGFSVGSIYNFFGNKAGIVCDFTKNIYREATEQMLFDKESIEHPKKAIIKFYQSIADEFERYGWEIAKASMETCSEEYRAGGDLEYRNVSLQTINTLFDSMVKNGRWKCKESVEKVAEQIHMEFMGIIITWIYFPIHDSLREAIDINIPALLDKFDF